MRDKPSDGTAMQLLRVLKGRYAMSIEQVARNLKLSHRQAHRYVLQLENDGVIFLRYRQRCNYYALRRSE
jgi:predicted ArsR family transcriptional regulator